MIRMTIYAGPPYGSPEVRPASTTTRLVHENDLNEELRRVGLEWKTADYFGDRQVVIVLDPVEDTGDAENVKQKVRAAAESLEQTGLL